MKNSIIEPLEKPFSAIGLGCVTFGREIDKKASFAMMDHALEHGITFFDTASAYGSGSSETIIGAWLAEHKSAADRLIIATKVLPPFDRSNIISSVDQSLKRLGMDSVDLLYLHRWDPSFQSPIALDTFEELVRLGKIRMLGASNFNGDQLRKSLRLQRDLGYSSIRSVQNNQNLAVSDLGEDLLNQCVEQHMAMVTYSPLGAGFLTGKYQQGMPEHTRFAVIPGHQEVYFHEHAYQRLARLQTVAERTDYSRVHLALAWALHQPGITSTLVGGRTPDHLNQAFKAMDFNDPAIFEELEC